VKVAVVSSCYGAIDQLVSPPPQLVDADEWVMVHDLALAPQPWRSVREVRGWAHPRFAAKHAKCQPFDYVDSDVAIWLDSGARITSVTFVAECVKALGDADVACWPHPQRATIYEEAAVSAPIPKYHGMDVFGQVESYGDPPGLFATGCIVWRNTDTNRRLGAAWLSEQLRWGVQDQLSFPYVLHTHGVTPNPLPGGLYNSGLVTWTGH
jgi:hypothetical protein